MTHFDYVSPAELFFSRRKPRTARAVTYLRFATTAEAIRYAVEELPAAAFPGTYLEANEERFDSGAIRSLYDADETRLPGHRRRLTISWLRDCASPPRRALEHDPEKWVPVFGTDHAQSIN